MNWIDLVPESVAVMQHAWERRRAMWRMRQFGFKYHEIGQRFGVGTTGARALCLKGKIDLDRGFSPVEHWVADDGWELRRLASKAIKATRRANLREMDAAETIAKEAAKARLELRRAERDVYRAEKALTDARRHLEWVRREYTVLGD